jgi:hypothetical protein
MSPILALTYHFWTRGQSSNVLVHSLDLPGSSCSEILLGDSEVVLTGGSESMSQAPYAVRNARWGTKLGQDLKMEDTLWAGLTGIARSGVTFTQLLCFLYHARMY